MTRRYDPCPECRKPMRNGRCARCDGPERGTANAAPEIQTCNHCKHQPLLTTDGYCTNGRGYPGSRIPKQACERCRGPVGNDGWCSTCGDFGGLTYRVNDRGHYERPAGLSKSLPSKAVKWGFRVLVPGVIAGVITSEDSDALMHAFCASLDADPAAAPPEHAEFPRVIAAATAARAAKKAAGLERVRSVMGRAQLVDTSGRPVRQPEPSALW